MRGRGGTDRGSWRGKAGIPEGGRNGGGREGRRWEEWRRGKRGTGVERNCGVR